MNELDRFRIDGRVVVIPGGTGGIGMRLAEAFVDVGAQVVLVGRSAEHLKEAEEGVNANGKVSSVVADVTKGREAEEAIHQVMVAHGRVDVLVNCVGGGAGSALYPAEEYPESEWDRIVDLNLRSALLATQPAVRAMVSGGRGGRILNISSVRGQLGISLGYSAYVAAKGALNALTRQWATEWAKHGITVNAISPTFVATQQVAALLADPDFRARLESRIPLGRVGQTDDLVGAALLLCSDASAFVTGQILTIDGGLTATQ